MKKILSILVIALIITGNAQADDISVEQALQIASRLANDSTVAKLRNHHAPTAKPTLSLAHCMKSRVSEGKDNVYVINLGNDLGFVVISGEDGAVSEILGYCDHGSFNYDNAPLPFLDLLNEYSDGIDCLRKNPAIAKTKSKRRLLGEEDMWGKEAWDKYVSMLGGIVVGPLLTTTWNQRSPYNLMIPDLCPTGCVPTAVAQVMKYWKWPKQSKGQIIVRTETGEEVSEDFPVHTYDWDNMVDDYEWAPSSWEQKQAVALLMADVGKAMGTMYSQNASPTYFLYDALIENFGYEPGIESVFGNTALDMAATIKGELNQNRPVLYTAYPNGDGDGHTMVCDGYTNYDYFHFNYGWGGSTNGFYRLTSVPNYTHKVTVWKNVRPFDAVIKEIGGIKYGLNANGTADVMEYIGGDENSGAKVLVIPDYVTDEDTGNQYAVTYIRRSAFFSKGHFDKVIIGNNIETIEPFSFVGSYINTLVLSDKMEVVPERAFFSTNITHLTIGENIKRIGKQAFYACPLTNIDCKSSQVELETEAFAGSRPNRGDWEKCIVKINKKAFKGATLSRYTYFENLEVLCDSATFGANWDGRFNIGPKMREIAPSAFDGMYNSAMPFLCVDSQNPYFAEDDFYPIIYNKNKTSIVIALSSPIEWPETVIKMEPGSVRNVSGFVFPQTIVDLEGACKDCSAPNSYSSVVCPLLVPPVISDATFSKDMFSDENYYYTLEVPPGTESLYAEAPGWRKFGHFCIIPIYDFENRFSPLPPQALNYHMVVHGETQNTTIETEKVNSIRMSENENGEAMVAMSINGRDDITVNAAAIDSITFKPGFIYEGAEVFEINSSSLTVNAQKCTITFSPTTIDENAQVCVRNSALIPRPTEGVAGGVGIDISMLDENGNEVHELCGVAKIVIPFQAPADHAVGASYFNEQTGEWEPVYVDYNREAGVATILTNHLSFFGLVHLVDERTRGECFEADCYAPQLYTFDQGTKLLLNILDSDEPEVEAALEFKNEMGLWQSLVLDGFYQGVIAATEPIFDFKPEAIDNAVSIMGEIGTALTILDVIRADLKGDDLGVASNTLKVLMAKTAGAAASWIGTPVMAASMSLAAFIGVALEKFGTAVQDYKMDYFRAAYRYYYSMQGYKELAPQSKYNNDAQGNRKPHGYFRTIKDWYKYFYPVFLKEGMNEERLRAFIDQSVRMYCDQFWTENTDVQTWAFAEARKQGFSSFWDSTESLRQQISDEYYAELMDGYLTSVFDALREEQIVQAYSRANSRVNRMAKFMNKKVAFLITDSSVEEGKPSKFTGRKIGFASVPDNVEDKDTWYTYIDEEGNAKLGWFTTFALVRNTVPFKITLFDDNDEPEKIFNFQLGADADRTVINIDLATDGVKDDTKHLNNLKLEYTPESVWLIVSGLSFNPLVQADIHETTLWKEYISMNMNDEENYYRNKVRWCGGLERFFNQHDFITVDPITGNFTIGDDIVGKLDGNTASGTFNINNDYQFVVKTAQQWLNDFNNKVNNDSDICLRTILSGSVKHQIACKYTLKRKQVGDHFEYDITYTGEGVWDNTVKRVNYINEPLSFDYQTELYNEQLYIDDIVIGTESHGGEVKLEYSTTLK